MNTPVERRGIDYIAQNYGKDSLVLVRNFVLSVMNEIAEAGKDSLCRRKAVNYILDYSFIPEISRLLTDFDEDAKQKIAKFLSRQHSEEEINALMTCAAQNFKKMMKILIEELKANILCFISRPLFLLIRSLTFISPRKNDLFKERLIMMFVPSCRIYNSAEKFFLYKKKIN